ncbi:MAG: potassium-transporting ATPase subunit KdpC [Anaerolineae bacterium]
MTNVSGLWRPALVSFLTLTILTGVAYPGLVTVVAQAAFPSQANGSIVEREGRALGSDLIGQPFADPGYFWGRPSATSPYPYNAAGSGGSNLGPSNPVLRQLVAERIAALRQADPGNTAGATDRAPVPVDLVTASGSGLDPHISLAAAYYQVPRIARARGIAEDDVRALVDRHVEGRLLWLFGEPRVNVLEMNLDLDGRW